MSYLRRLEKGKQSKSKPIRREEITKRRVETNQVEDKQAIKKINLIKY